MIRFLKWFAVVVVLLVAGTWLLSMREIPQAHSYGVSFSKLHSEELGLDWKETYFAILDDLGVKKLRLSAHWPMVEPERDAYDFSALDFQMREARARNVSVILAIGKKTPGWPECHIPQWVGYMGWDEQKMELKQYITVLVERYKDYPNLRYWQVENEPFLNFARERCGDPDEEFLKEEIALVKSLDPDHSILVTDGGEFGLWHKARSFGDVFGSTMYLYVYTKHIGYWRYPIGGWFFRAKQNVLNVLGGKKESISIEVGLEPWLHEPIIHSSIEEQLEHMNMDRFDSILHVAQTSGFSEHYLWGAEWWYYMSLHGHTEFWNKAKELFN